MIINFSGDDGVFLHCRRAYSSVCTVWCLSLKWRWRGVWEIPCIHCTYIIILYKRTYLIYIILYYMYKVSRRRSGSKGRPRRFAAQLDVWFSNFRGQSFAPGSLQMTDLSRAHVEVATAVARLGNEYIYSGIMRAHSAVTVVRSTEIFCPTLYTPVHVL